MSTLHALVGSEWVGKKELWLDPHGNDAALSDCRVRVGAESVEYEWSHDGTSHTGRLVLRPYGLDFLDTFHSAELMKCTASTQPRALVDVTGAYGGAEGPEWGWRITLAQRPGAGDEAGELVLQMTNIAPWGEEARAVRMVCRRA